MLIQDRLKELFSYDPLTGVFINLQSSGKRKAGNIAGSKHNAGYVKIFADGASYLAHRLAHLYMTGELPTEHMDHINHSEATTAGKTFGWSDSSKTIGINERIETR